MKTDSLNIQGSLKIERVDSLPVWNSSYTGRVLYSIADDKMYVGKASGFEEAGGGADNFGLFNYDPYGDGVMDVLPWPYLYFEISRHLVWEKLIIDGDVSRNWSAADLDQDGSNIIVAEENGRLYTSSNRGVSWTERRPDGNNDKPWCSVSSDSDGSFLVAAYKANGLTSGKLFISTNSGSTWSEIQPAGSSFQDWRCVSVSQYGNYICAASYGQRLWMSLDSGSTWKELRPTGDTNQNWDNVSCSYNGDNVIASIYDGGLYWTNSATFQNTTWYVQRPGGITAGRYKTAILNNSSLNGAYTIAFAAQAGQSNGLCYYLRGWEAETGNGWDVIYPATDHSEKEFCVATASLPVAGAGSVVYHAAYNGRLYGCFGFGIFGEENTYEQRPDGDSNHNWKVLALADNCLAGIAACNPGNIYIMRQDAYAVITPFDIIRSIRGGVPPYTYDIKNYGGSYVGGSDDPKVPILRISCAEMYSASITVKVTDSLGTTFEINPITVIEDRYAYCI